MPGCSAPRSRTRATRLRPLLSATLPGDTALVAQSDRLPLRPGGATETLAVLLRSVSPTSAVPLRSQSPRTRTNTAARTPRRSAFSGIFAPIRLCSQTKSIGAPGFELGTSPTRTVRATRLRHAPTPPAVSTPARRYLRLDARRTSPRSSRRSTASSNRRALRTTAKTACRSRARRQVTTLATGVSAHAELFELAAAERAELLVVHHGLFWGAGVEGDRRRAEASPADPLRRGHRA